jgi:nucleoside-diphosphate kinase
MERTLVLLKPDALQRGIAGEIIDRFEQKGLKIVGLKFIRLSDSILDRHYAEHKGKPFLPRLKEFMKRLPVVAIALEGLEAARVVRAMCGTTDGKNAPPGTIRGDYGMSRSANIVHSSSDAAAAKREVKIFFKPAELFSYTKPDIDFYYAEDELS